MVGAIVFSQTDAASQEAAVGSAQRVVVARARAPRDAAVKHCLEHLNFEHPDFELEGSAVGRTARGCTSESCTIRGVCAD